MHALADTARRVGGARDGSSSGFGSSDNHSHTQGSGFSMGETVEFELDFAEETVTFCNISRDPGRGNTTVLKGLSMPVHAFLSFDYTTQGTLLGQTAALPSQAGALVRLDSIAAAGQYAAATGSATVSIGRT